MVIAGGEGSYVWDYDGNRFLDFSSQLVNVNIGHQHPKVVAAIQAQAATLATVAPQHANDARGEAAKRIADLAPEGLNKVFFTNGGADANENAVRMARLHTGRRKVMSFYRCYHGNTGSAIASTGDPRRWPNEFAEAHVHFFGPYALPLVVLGGRRGAGVRARAAAPRADDPVRGPRDHRRDPHRDRRRHRRRADPAARLPRGRPRAVRPARHRPHPRRGHGRLRPLRHVVRVRQLRRRSPTSSPSPRAATPATSRSAASSSATRSPRPSTTASSPAASPTPATRSPAPRSSRRSTR